MDYQHPRMNAILGLGAGLAFAAEASARALKTACKHSRTTRGVGLKPGADTPLWNELTLVLRQQKWTYGEKAKLGRILGLPRQRVDDFIVGRRRLPNAEHTLLILHWLNSRQKGSHLS